MIGPQCHVFSPSCHGHNATKRQQNATKRQLKMDKNIQKLPHFRRLFFISYHFLSSLMFPTVTLFNVMNHRWGFPHVFPGPWGPGSPSVHPETVSRRALVKHMPLTRVAKPWRGRNKDIRKLSGNENRTYTWAKY